jgi:hypothetical protein
VKVVFKDLIRIFHAASEQSVSEIKWRIFKAPELQPLELNLVLDSTTKVKVENRVRNLVENRLVVIQAIAKKG